MTTQSHLKMKKIGEHDRSMMARQIQQTTRSRKTDIGNRIILTQVVKRAIHEQLAPNQEVRFSKLDQARRKILLGKVITRVTKALSRRDKGTRRVECMTGLVSTFTKMVRLLILMVTSSMKMVTMSLVATTTRTTTIADQVVKMQATQTNHVVVNPKRVIISVKSHSP